MNPNPTGQPMGTSAPSGAAQEMVNVPSILLMVIAGLMILYALFSVVRGGGSVPPEQMAQVPPQAREIIEQVQRFGRPVSIVVLLVNGLILYGALQMRQLKSFGLAMTSAILVMIPCFTSCCCLLGLPIGIWAIITLNKPEVKSAFS